MSAPDQTSLGSLLANVAGPAAQPIRTLPDGTPEGIEPQRRRLAAARGPEQHHQGPGSAVKLTLSTAGSAPQRLLTVGLAGRHMQFGLAIPR